MATLNSLLRAMKSSSNSGWGTSSGSGWGGSSHTWGGKSTGFKATKFGKKTSESQAVANRIMSGAKAKASHSHESALGSILGGIQDVTGNLVKDVVSTAENTPSGLLKIATTNPMDTIHAIGKDYKTRYGKLFSGDIGGFASDLKSHPLSYLLDAATVATAGTGALAKVGVLSNELSTTGLSLSRASNVAHTGETLGQHGSQMALFGGEGAAKVEVNLSRNPFTRQVQKGAYKIQSKLPEKIPLIGENAAASRAVAQEYQHVSAGMPTAEKQIIRDAFLGHFGEASRASLSKYGNISKPGGDLLGKSTQHWKDLVLAGRPAYQVNNLVGNTGMGLMVMGRSFFKAQTLATKGELNKAADFFSGSMHTFGGTEKAVVENPGLYRRAVNKSYNLQGKHETMLRKSVMYSAAMKIPEIKTLVRQYTGKGMSEGDALAAAFHDAFRGDHGAALHREIRGKIDDALGDYSRYSAGEQRLKKVVPFYGWNRHASRFLYSTARDRPGQLLALNQISKIGEAAHQQWGWGGTPDFMKGYLKIGGHTFDTAPLNPLKGGTDTLKSVKQLVSGNVSTEGTDLASNLNPFIATGIQAITGKNLLTGAPVARNAHGLLGSVGQQVFTGLPQVRLAQKLLPAQGLDASNPHTFLTPTGQLKAKFKDANGHVKLDSAGNPVEQGNRHMLNSSAQSMIASFLGVPDRGTVNKDVAKSVAKKIETNKHPDRFHPRKKRKKKVTFKTITNTTRTSGWGASSSGWGG